jgi:hypothetical protein
VDDGELRLILNPVLVRDCGGERGLARASRPLDADKSHLVRLPTAQVLDDAVDG